MMIAQITSRKVTQVRRPSSALMSNAEPCTDGPKLAVDHQVLDPVPVLDRQRVVQAERVLARGDLARRRAAGSST